jgi:internalin A
MKNFESYPFIVPLLCFVFISIVCGRTKSETFAANQPSTWEFIQKSRMKQVKTTGPVSVERVLHFPKEQSLGLLLIQDSNLVRNIKTFHYWTEAGDSEWESLGEAKGSIAIPKGKRLALIINSSAKDLSCLSGLKPDDLYELRVGRNDDNGRLPGSRFLPYIINLKGLRVLNFINSECSAKDLKYLSSLKSLERLTTPYGLTDDGLVEIAKLSSLKALYITSEHNLTNDCLANLENLPLLEELDIIGKGRVNDDGLSHLAKVPRLRYLALQGLVFTDDGIAHIKNSTSIRILHLGSQNQLTNTTLVCLSQMPQLERLNLHWNENITNEGIFHLTKLKSLTMLDIKHSKVTDEGLVHLAKIKTLENLTLPDACVTDAGIEHIAQLQNLRYLWVSSPLTDKSLHYIGALENLEELHIGGTGFSDEGMKDIAKLKKLRRLSVFTADQLTNDSLAVLSVLGSLTDFYLGSKTKVSISGLKSLNSLKKLKNLTIHDVHQDGSVMDISRLTDLEVITLLLHRQREGDSFVSDSFKNEDWTCLANLTKMKRLQITGVGIGDEGVQYLSDMKKLEFLNIICPGEGKITDEALKYMARMHKLNRLYVKDGHFTDKALDYLNGLPALYWLELTSDYAFSTKAIRDFQRKNPHVTRLQLIP